MFQAPNWVPYRIRARWDQWRIDRAVSGLADTRPTPAIDPDAADAELFLQVCRRDLRITPVAVKALLRFGPRLAVTFMDDGTLAEADREWVNTHVPNARWLARQIGLRFASVVGLCILFLILANIVIGQYYLIEARDEILKLISIQGRSPWARSSNP